MSDEYLAYPNSLDKETDDIILDMKAQDRRSTLAGLGLILLVLVFCIGSLVGTLWAADLLSTQLKSTIGVQVDDENLYSK